MEGWQKAHITKNLDELIKVTEVNSQLLASLQSHEILSKSDVELLGGLDPIIRSLNFTCQSGAVKILEDHATIFRNNGTISFDKSQVIGAGSSGTKVFKGTFQKRDVAVKVVNRELVDLETIVREVGYLRQLDSHENIVRHFIAESHKHYVYIANELCVVSLQDEVYQKLVKMNPATILEKVTKGLDYMHGFSVVHRDLNPTNILLKHNEQVKIADFSLSQLIPDGQRSVTLNSESDLWERKSLDWMAPEVLHYLNEGTTNTSPIKMSKSSDIFSLGCIFFFTMTNGLHPFGERIDRSHNIARDKPQLDTCKIESGWLQLIQRMISACRNDRPSTQDTLSNILFITMNGMQGQRSVPASDNIEVKEDDSSQSFTSTQESTCKSAESTPFIKPTSLEMLQTLIVQDNKPTITLDENHVLGTGSLGTKIYKGTFESREVAVKVVDTEVVGSDTAMREVDFLRKLDGHENVIRNFFVEKHENLVYIALEIMDVSLQDEVHQKLVKTSSPVILEKVTKGLDYLHSSSVLHGNLNPTNILLNHNEQVKITDFGLSQLVPDGKSAVTVSSAGVKHEKWMAPEVLKNVNGDSQENTGQTEMSKASEIFSLGCIFYFTLTDGSHPTDRISLTSGIKPKLDNTMIEEKWLQLIKKMISTDPNDRPSTHDTLSDTRVIANYITQPQQLFPDSNSTENLKMEDIIRRYDELLKGMFEYKKCSLLHVAVREGNLEAIKFLITSGEDVNAKDNDGETPFLWSVMAKRNFKEVLTMLNENGAEVNVVNQWGENLLYLAACEQRPEQDMKHIVDIGVDRNHRDSKGNTMLHHAARNGNPYAVRYFVSLGVNTESKNIHGETALLQVVYMETKKNFTETVKTLVEMGANINAVDNHRWSILFLAMISLKPSVEDLRAIVKCGADKELRDKTGGTVLHFAVDFDNLEAVKYFISLGCDVNAKDHDKYTPLHRLEYCKTNFAEILKVLLEHGAQINAVTKYDSTLLDLLKRDKSAKEKMELVKSLGGEFKWSN